MFEDMILKQVEKRAPELIAKHKDKAAGIITDALKTLLQQHATGVPGTRCIMYIETEPQYLSVVVLSVVNGVPAISRILNKYSISQLVDMAADGLIQELRSNGIKKIASQF